MYNNKKRMTWKILYAVVFGLSVVTGIIAVMLWFLFTSFEYASAVYLWIVGRALFIALPLLWIFSFVRLFIEGIKHKRWLCLNTANIIVMPVVWLLHYFWFLMLATAI